MDKFFFIKILININLLIINENQPKISYFHILLKINIL